MATDASNFRIEAGVFESDLAAFFGAFMILLFYFDTGEVVHGVVMDNFAYLIELLAVAAFGAGRLLELDALVEKFDAGGEALVEMYSELQFVRG